MDCRVVLGAHVSLRLLVSVLSESYAQLALMPSGYAMNRSRAVTPSSARVARLV